MSRIGKKVIAIPEKTELTLSDGVLHVKGPQGEISKEFNSDITVTIEGKEVKLTPVNTTLETNALWGTYASHIMNMIDGVNKPYEKKLSVEGVGFKWDVQGDTINLALGFSHPVKVKIPTGIAVKVEKLNMTITGVDKDKVGQFAANIRALKKPEPYKGKGIRYEGEHVRRKQGKKTA